LKLQQLSVVLHDVQQQHGLISTNIFPEMTYEVENEYVPHFFIAQLISESKISIGK